MEVDNERLRVHTKPDLDSEIVCEVKYMAEFILSIAGSTEKFYRVYTSMGADGYCSRDQFAAFSKGESAWKVS